MDINWNLLLDAAVFSILGIIIFLLAFFIYEKLTPVNLWKEITEKQNVAVAIVVGAVMIGLSVIIAFAHG